MTAKKKGPLFRVFFNNQGKVYEIYAHKVFQSSLMGFVEVEELVFEPQSSVIVNPEEDNLKREFENTERCYIPIHSIIRIDEVDRSRQVKPRVISLNSKNGDSPKPDISPYSNLITPKPEK